MPQIANTPESLLPRSDSRNPATTCRGITTQGRPCRRALVASQIPSASPWKRGTVNQLPDQSALYCWQHKDQAASSTAWNGQMSPIKSRTSIDTLMDRLGVLEVKDEQHLPPKTHQRRRTHQSGLSEKRKPRRKRTICCFEIVDDSDEDSRPPKLSQRPIQSEKLHQIHQRPVSAGRPQYARLPSGQRVSSAPQTSSRPAIPKTRKSSSSSQTQSLLSWIPSTLSPGTTSLLLTELAKPISTADEEGYIYMFWVTPQSTSTSSNARPERQDIASSLFPQTPPSKDTTLRPSAQPRSVSDALRAARDLNALASNPTPTTPGTIRLKIGRTSNVHRRLNEWTRQCSHDLTLIRYYPYTPSTSASPSPARMPPACRDRSDSRNNIPNAHLIPGRKVPHVHRVERLIHLELAGLRVRDLGRCGECGKEHREWFEVGAAKEALRRVDECVRRWVSWGESMG